MSRKHNIKKIVLISIPVCILLAMMIAFSVLYFKAAVSVREVGEEHLQYYTFTQERNPAYAVGYNSYGRVIFKHPGRALKQFKKEYADALAYMEMKEEFPEFSNQYEVMKQYGVFCWQITVDEEMVENAEQLEKQIREISRFVNQYWDGKWRNYLPACFQII